MFPNKIMPKNLANAFDKNWNDFLTKYRVGGKQRAKRERETDGADFYTVILCVIKSSIETQFLHVSNSTFNKFVVTYDAISREIKWRRNEPLLEPRSKRFDNLVVRSHNICEFELEFEKLTEILYQTFNNVMAKM
ncbi:hypothetical protein Ahy_B03g067446 [Arachis hypogaea]|uniref:Protein FAR1-RELATED SEQUENCE n=1 Tax=Arachis hypogaea TaxID=3818 RepID=A0A445A6Y2_ARAHY|nr:hypothetical protein Ahy_B03g067446 [Arachis hypogaea]